MKQNKDVSHFDKNWNPDQPFVRLQKLLLHSLCMLLAKSGFSKNLNPKSSSVLRSLVINLSKICFHHLPT